MCRSAGLLALELEFGLVAASASTAKTHQVYHDPIADSVAWKVVPHNL